MKNASDQHEPTWVDAEDPLFMLYTRSVDTVAYISIMPGFPVAKLLPDGWTPCYIDFQHQTGSKPCTKQVLKQ